MLIQPFLRHLPDNYVALLSEVNPEPPFSRSLAWANLVPFAHMAAEVLRPHRGGNRRKKRAVLAFVPNDQVSSILDRQGHQAPDEGAETAILLTQLLRAEAQQITALE